MAQRHYSSTAAAMQLQGSVNGSSVSLTVDAVVGLPTSYPFTVVIDPGTESEEIVTVTNVAGTTLTVIRGEDGTAGVPHSGGAAIRHMVTARDLREPQQHIEATSGVHGVEGPLSQLLPTGTTLPFLSAVAPSGFLLADGSSRLRAEDPDLFALIGTTWGEGDDPGNTFALPNLIDRAVVGAGGDYALGDLFGAASVELTEAEIPAHTHSGSTSSGGAHTHTGSTSTAGSHSHSVSHDAAGERHVHPVSGVAMISPATNGSMYFVRRSGTVETADWRIDASWNGGSTNRSTWVAVEGLANEGRFTSPNPNLSASISVGSNGSHTHTVTANSAGSHSHSFVTASTGGGAAHDNVQPSAALYWIIKR